MPMPQRIKLALQWLTVGAVVAYFTYSQYQSHLVSTKQEAQRQAETDALVGKLHNVARQFGAQVDWARNLEGKDSIRLSPVMSAELQEVWLQPSPILFVGTLRDIVRNEDGSFQVLPQYDALSGGSHLLSTELFFSAQCAAELATPLLAMAKTAHSTVFANVAIVGKVLGVTSKQVRGSDGEDETQLTGSATCSAALPIDRHLPRQWTTRAAD